jgi:hypothetical protein
MQFIGSERCRGETGRDRIINLSARGPSALMGEGPSSGRLDGFTGQMT